MYEEGFKDLISGYIFCLGCKMSPILCSASGNLLWSNPRRLEPQWLGPISHRGGGWIRRRSRRPADEAVTEEVAEAHHTPLPIRPPGQLFAHQVPLGPFSRASQAALTRDLFTGRLTRLPDGLGYLSTATHGMSLDKLLDTHWCMGASPLANCIMLPPLRMMMSHG